MLPAVRPLRLLAPQRRFHSWSIPPLKYSPKHLLSSPPLINDVINQLQRFDSSIPISSATMPPSSWYLNDNMMQAELAGIFSSTWQLVCRRDQVSQPKQYVATFIGIEPIIIVRGEDGILRALANVCRHHAARIMKGEGSASELSCPYHGWTYTLNGRLHRTTKLKGIECFSASTTCLPNYLVEEWGPFVFVKIAPTTNSESPKPWELPVHQQLSALTTGDQKNVDFNDFHFFKRRIYEIGCNWKVYIDNYLDGGYHIPTLHLGLDSELQMKSYQTSLESETLSIQTCLGKGERIGDDRKALYNFLFPNLAVNVYGDFLDTNLVIPISVDRCVIVFDWYHKDKGFTCEDDALVRSQKIQDEDVEISESVQSGIASCSYEAGRYAPGVEVGEYHFHKMIQKISSGLSPETTTINRVVIVVLIAKREDVVIFPNCYTERLSFITIDYFCNFLED